jgi:uncharacterized membrane protein
MGILFDDVGLHFLLRWLHFLAGIAWIGMLYYFNLVQTPFFGKADAAPAGDPLKAAKGVMVRNVVPTALWWFRWGAMFTFLTGLGMIELSRRQGATMSGPYMTLILTGALLGTLMWFNVWFVIWPAQKVVIASAEQVAAGGQPLADAAARGKKAGMVSRTNAMLSIPMLFFMGAASHLSALGVGTNLGIYWGIVLAIVLACEWNALAGTDATQKVLKSVSGFIHAGIVLTVVFFLVARFVLAA